METYEELLQRPEWQELRKMLVSAWPACMRCDARDRELHVHHRYYTPGVMPWDYPVTAFEILCDKCHAAHHGKRTTPIDTERDDWSSRPVKSIGLLIREEIERTIKDLEKGKDG
jgi:hypothetical protein